MANRAETSTAWPDHDRLAELLYAGITETKPFDGFLKALRTAVDAESSTLIIERQRRDRPGAIYSATASEERIARYNALYAEDPFIDLPLGKVTTLAELVGEEGFSRSEFMTGSGWQAPPLRIQMPPWHCPECRLRSCFLHRSIG
ncbi:hypothetical protein [Aminobacter sp. HY435]|uniref:hypothetical protein n=1 Tax=Aminobacter sp. HY435 TaxID=2970917 RepID=UPI0022B991D5|nr:hypothetical protein [Aminobacter sp. HY435]